MTTAQRLGLKTKNTPQERANNEKEHDIPLCVFEIINGASRRNRTDDTCLEGRGFTIKLYSQSQAESETFGLSVKHFIKI